ncbi:50S ribosomal protein L11 methyltransferase [Clostridium intestinale]|uniref:Ribosomal protein L11 methyltransferase n=1 Tax=Clostridium intestinale DSM 6191 TaxID=1121320 RepID=A0A1M5XWQ9_9CLOT|nr:50S ribosomal protein L11 methyltransferase [Clostridium intestinale]SHI04004.1 ribosomal protein L11 methyltransferase [Clostridium intestinale DSM 6191]
MIVIFEVLLRVKNSLINETIEKLEILGVSSTYYDVPYEVTVDDNGYGYFEKEDKEIDLHVYFYDEDRSKAGKLVDKIKDEFEIEETLELVEVSEDNWQQSFEPIDLNNGWIIAEKDYSPNSLNKINFESQGSFGTGLHETTQDLLRYILDRDFQGESVLDLGAGSGILSLAASIKNADRVVALDIRDVTEEVLYNASLNNIDNIEVAISDVTSKTFGVSGKFDVVFINIGGEETLSSMDFINEVLKPKGLLFVSGMVEWSSEKVLDIVKSYGYTLDKSTKTNEWVTAVLIKNK